MSGTLRITLAGGLLLLLANLSLRHFRSREVRLGDLFEAVGPALTTLVLPGAAEMIVKAFGGSALPIFNTAEDRMSLILGGAAVIVGIAYGDFTALRRAWGDKRS